MPVRLDAVRSSPNGLTALRLGLSIIVLIAHSWPLGGFGEAPGIGHDNAGVIAVAGFFVISGYLIAGSRLTLSLPRFAWHRFLRIYPGFWVAILMVAFVFAPASALIAGAYDPAEAMQYVLANATVKIRQAGVPGTLPAVPFRPVGESPWDGSLWTLFYEVACYILAGLWLTASAIRRRPWTTWLAYAAFSALSFAPLGPEPATLVSFGAMFAAGAAWRVSDAAIPLDGRLALIAAVAAWWVIADGHLVLAAPPLAYVLLWCAHRAPSGLKGWRQDYSYGVYIYAFPVQQMLALAGAQHFGLVPFTAFAVAAVLPLAAASWWLVERRALSFKGGLTPTIRSSGWWGTVGRRPSCRSARS